MSDSVLPREEAADALARASEFPRVLNDDAFDRMIETVESITKQREIVVTDDSAVRRVITMAAQMAAYCPAPRHADKREVLNPMLARRRISRESPKRATVERARKKLETIYAGWRGWSLEEVPPPAFYGLPPPDILDRVLRDAAMDELAGRPPQRDNHTVILLRAYWELFGVKPRASLARKRLPDWGIEDSGAAVYFIWQFEAEVAAALEDFASGVPGLTARHFQRRTLTSIRDHIDALVSSDSFFAPFQKQR